MNFVEALSEKLHPDVVKPQHRAFRMFDNSHLLEVIQKIGASNEAPIDLVS